MSTPRKGGPRQPLPANPSVENLKKQAKRLSKGRPSLSLQQVQHQLAKSYGFNHWDDLLLGVADARRDAAKTLERRIDAGTFTPYRRIAFSFAGPNDVIDPSLSILQFQVEEVYGTSLTMAKGERYVVRGKYELPGTIPYVLSLMVFTTSFGAEAYLQPGAGRFSTSLEALDLSRNHPNGLGIVIANSKTGKCNIVRWITLKA